MKGREMCPSESLMRSYIDLKSCSLTERQSRPGILCISLSQTKQKNIIGDDLLFCISAQPKKALREWL
jgi:hypothetical protein